VVYYIPPKVWAWKSGRAQILKEQCDAILGILPFEQKWYADRNIDYAYVGNPLAQKYAGVNAYAPHGSIALLPGSRSQEIARLVPEFIAVAQAMPKQSFVLIRPESAVPVWPNLEIPGNIKVFTGELKDGMQHCSAALVCSGTATLEVALMGVPQLVVYRANPLSLAIAKRFVKIRYISLPNLILNAGALPELLQEDARAEVLVERLGELLTDPSTQLNAYTNLLLVLEQKDPAATAADHILTISSDV
jgi:lipid-A-disaccharide synthase